MRRCNNGFPPECVCDLMAAATTAHSSLHLMSSGFLLIPWHMTLACDKRLTEEIQSAFNLHAVKDTKDTFLKMFPSLIFLKDMKSHQSAIPAWQYWPFSWFYQTIKITLLNSLMWVIILVLVWDFHPRTTVHFSIIQWWSSNSQRLLTDICVNIIQYLNTDKKH